VTSGETVRGPHSSFVATLVNAAIVGAEDKLARDIVVLDMRGLVDSFDALVLTSGRNDRQVRAIAEQVERLVDQALEIKPLRVEGWDSAQWIALDYGDVIVHVFDEDSREYYDLEHLWNAAPALRAEPIA